MAASAGYKAYVNIDNAGGSPTNLSTYADNFELGVSTEMLETTCFSAAGTNVKTFIPGLAGGDTIPVAGPLDTTLYTHVVNCMATQAAGGSTFTVLYGAAGSVASAPKQTCEAYFANFKVSTGVGGRAEFSADLQITGAVTNSTW